jgi:hypothetical protein
MSVIQMTGSERATIRRNWRERCIRSDATRRQSRVSSDNTSDARNEGLLPMIIKRIDSVERLVHLVLAPATSRLVGIR